MSEQPQYNSAFVRALAEVLDEILIPPEGGPKGGFSMMLIMAKSLKPEIPEFLAGLDGNDGMRNMFGGIILRLGDAVRADNKAMKEAEKIAHKKATEELRNPEEEEGLVIQALEELEEKEEKDDKEDDS